jgi:hypothetical protein
VAAAATEDIDSEWPDDEEASVPNLKKPVFPTSAKVPAEASGLGDAAAQANASDGESDPADRVSKRPTMRTDEVGKRPQASGAKPALPSKHEGKNESLAPSPVVAVGGGPDSSEVPPPVETEAAVAASAGAAPTAEAGQAGHAAQDETATTATPSERPKSEARFSEPSIERFEAAASAVVGDNAFGLGDGKPPKGETTDGTRPGESLAPSQSDSKPPAAANKKQSPALVIGLAAAAVLLLLGIGLATRGGGASDPNIERAENALKPDPASEKAMQAEAKAVKPESKPDPAPPATLPSASDAETDDAEADDAKQESDEAKGDATETDGDDEAETMAIQVNIFPPDAQIYHKGKLLARAGGTVALKKGERKLLVLIRNGYWPRKLILDGSQKAYNIGLRAQPPSTFLPKEDTPAPPSGPGAPQPNVAKSAAPKAPAPAASAP